LCEIQVKVPSSKFFIQTLEPVDLDGSTLPSVENRMRLPSGEKLGS
jgi:hypothetical protein